MSNFVLLYFACLVNIMLFVVPTFEKITFDQIKLLNAIGEAGLHIKATRIRDSFSMLQNNVDKIFEKQCKFDFVLSNTQ